MSLTTRIIDTDNGLTMPWLNRDALDFIKGNVRAWWRVFEWGAGYGTLWWQTIIWQKAV
jgi:hypothetical protein